MLWEVRGLLWLVDGKRSRGIRSTSGQVLSRHDNVQHSLQTVALNKSPSLLRILPAKPLH